MLVARRLLVACLLSASLCGCFPRAEPEPVWVGLAAPLTGADQEAGAHVAHGVELAVDEAVSGGVRVEGRAPAVIRADDRGEAAAAQAEAVRLLTVNRVAALLGGPDPGRGEALARAAQPYDAPVVLPCELAGDLPGDATFTLGVRPAWRGRALAHYAARELKAGRAAVLTDGRDPVAAAVAAGFAREWPRDDKSSLREWTYHTDAEGQEQATRVIDASPNVVLVAAPAAEFVKLRGRLGAGGAQAPVLYGGPDAGPEAFAGERGGPDVFLATVYAAEALTDRGRDFARRYQDRFHEPPDLTAAQGYDAARLLFDAMARANSAEADRVRGRLAATADYESVTGPLTMADRRARRPVFVVRVKDGGARLVQTVAAEAADAAP